MTDSLLRDGADKAPALVGEERTISYGQLRAHCAKLADVVHGLVFLRAELTLSAVSFYVACIEAKAPVLLVDTDTELSALSELIERYRPRLVVGFDGPAPAGMREVELPGSGLTSWVRANPAATHPELALLLSTSGSTGSPKLVRLSRRGILSNADAIVAGLGISSDDVAITALPYSYTYGLSIITCHLRAGAAIVVTGASVVSGAFWQAVDVHRVTALAGVPTTYQLLRRMRWELSAHPSIRYATQAGGRLPDADREHFRDMFAREGSVFYVMYGQTEATARITITAPNDLSDHISTAGRVIDGGRLEIRTSDAHGVGEVWFHGPNVMLGYAESADDLARGDEQGGVLSTGDLGYLEGDLLFLTGRSKRIAKVFGKRVSLDEVEAWLRPHAEGAAISGADDLVVFIVGEAPADLRSSLAAHLHVHPSGVRLKQIDAIPLLSSGKVDYQALNQRA